MMIRKLILQNWKNFQNAEVEFSDRAFIVGPNASGKSNLLDAIRFLRDIVKQSGGLQYATASRGGIPKIRCLAARKKSDVSLEVHLSPKAEDEPEWIYRLSFKHSGGGIFRNTAKIIEEKVWSKSDNRWILKRTGGGKGEDSETVKFTHLEQPASNVIFRKIYHFFKEIDYLYVIPQLVRDADFYLISKEKDDFYGRNILERMLKTSEITRKAYFGKINEVLKIAVPQFRELNFIKDDKGIPHLEATYIHWRAKGAKQREFQFSDGTLRLIGFMWAMLDGNETILLEEPELHLHTEIIKRIPEFISKLQRKKDKTRQVMVATHSFDLLTNEGIGADEVILLKPDAEGTLVQKAEDIEEIRQYLNAGFSMADAVIPRTAPDNLDKINQLQIWK